MKSLIPLLACATAFAAQVPPAPPPAKAPANAPGKASAPVARAVNPRLLHPDLFKAKAPDLYRVKFTTTKGDFVVEVNRAWAPLGADRFYNLVRAGFFANASFFRAVPGFIVQFGISPNPAVTDVWQKATIHDDPPAQSNKTGTITFATGGPNQRTTQVFINLRDNAQLDSMGFAPFGVVTEGMNVVTSLFNGYGGMAETEGSGPRQELLMKQGKPYLDQNFPNLDSIKTAAVIFPAAPAPMVKKGPAPPAKN
jgi:peptidyl-prolyl cis-trans isomerase A (cyclophilin A)